MKLPSEFENRIRQMLGEEEYALFLSSMDGEIRKALRVNTLKLSAQEFASMAPQEWNLRPVPWEESGFYYDSAPEESCADPPAAPRPGKHPYHEMGLYYIQEPSAMAPGAAAGVSPGERVLDLCAAPGGKTTRLAAGMQGAGILVSNEIHPARAKILARNTERMGIRNVIVTNETPQALALRFPGWFDTVLVDAPCSGEGMFRKEEQALDMWSPENVALCAGRQQEILACAAAMVRPGGKLVYSTCTFSPEENEGTILHFLKENADFEVAGLFSARDGEPSRAAELGFVPGNPEWAAQVPDKKSLRDRFDSVRGSARIWPHKAEGEGHFLCLLKRGADVVQMPAAEYVYAGGSSGKLKKSGKHNKGNQRTQKRPKEEADALTGIIKDGVPERWAQDCGAELLTQADEVYMEPGGLDLDGLKVVSPGLHLGTWKKDRFEPAHALAMALDKENACRYFDCTFSQAQAYLKGESIPCGPEYAGWTLMTMEGFPLGWAKAAGGMLKNHYPKGLRR